MFPRGEGSVVTNSGRISGEWSGIQAQSSDGMPGGVGGHRIVTEGVVSGRQLQGIVARGTGLDTTNTGGVSGGTTGIRIGGTGTLVNRGAVAGSNAAAILVADGGGAGPLRIANAGQVQAENGQGIRVSGPDAVICRCGEILSEGVGIYLVGATSTGGGITNAGEIATAAQGIFAAVMATRMVKECSIAVPDLAVHLGPQGDGVGLVVNRGTITTGMGLGLRTAVSTGGVLLRTTGEPTGGVTAVDLGGTGDDRIEDGIFGDLLGGGSGGSEVSGQGGDDTIHGGAGDDAITTGGRRRRAPRPGPAGSVTATACGCPSGWPGICRRRASRRATVSGFSSSGRTGPARR
mgnify:CR=1 FL=1